MHLTISSKYSIDIFCGGHGRKLSLKLLLQEITFQLSKSTSFPNQKLNINIQNLKVSRTLKKSQVDPWNNVPYSTSVCDAKSSGELIGATILSTVKKAARLAVYEEIKIKVKNHQTEPTILPETDLGEISQPCCINAPNANHNEFKMLKSFAMEPPFAPWPAPGSRCSPVKWRRRHSYGENLNTSTKKFHSVITPKNVILEYLETVNKTMLTPI